MRYLLLCLLLTGCDLFTDMTKVVEVKTTEITWVRERPTHCGNQPQDTGCAEWNDAHTKCTITMIEGSADFVIAHEFRHCFGFVHSNGT